MRSSCACVRLPVSVSLCTRACVLSFILLFFLATLLSSSSSSSSSSLLFRFYYILFLDYFAAAIAYSD